ncbi:MAG: sigma-70 family RNA polymerase sigma factor, partial [Acetatifactor sp.]|nr:sigma-70 family RNA polymerase sigma factor [Acetatifactor sp.]
MDGKEIIPYIDPIFRFCCRRLSNRCDAEDLASEILCHILEGLGKYEIESLDSWVWRIAHNRYARFVAARKRVSALISDKELYDIENDYCQIDERSLEEEFEPVFKCLHRLSFEYRNIFVDYYMGEMSVKQLSQKYGLSETTVKWRLNVGREKIRKWIGEEEMEKVYQRINWNSKGCNGNMDSDRYLHTQIARAICQAAYEKPLTVEEISACTGIPAMYIEDELPRLEYGEALRKTGNKYVTDFIIFHLADRAGIEDILTPMIKEVTNRCEEVLWGRDAELERAGFYRSETGMERLGYIFVPYFLRKKIKDLKNNRLNLSDGNFPPRQDGGYGWFHIEETPDEKEQVTDYN